MEPFNSFLSPHRLFEWTPDLDHSFQLSKSAIIDDIWQRVEIFNMDKSTCLCTGCSQKGIGYFLIQKHYSYKDFRLDCCSDGSRIILAGSRFLTSAKRNYAPTEGEALAITWALEQTKLFTLGCPQLLVATDHKPLVKVFGNRTLDKILNMRLFWLK